MECLSDAAVLTITRIKCIQSIHKQEKVMLDREIDESVNEEIIYQLQILKILH